MARYQVRTTARHPNGTPAPLHTLTFYTDSGAGTLATLYVSEVGAPEVDNPYTTDASAIVDFWTEDATLWVLASGDSVPRPVNINISSGGDYNVMDYGAIGNGSADDTESIQDTIDAAAAAGGGIVFMPAGTYLVDFQASQHCLEILEKITLCGAGVSATIIKLKDSASHVADNDGMIFLGANAAAAHSGIVLRDFTLDGNLANQGTTYVYSGINTWYCDAPVFERLLMRNMLGKPFPSAGGETPCLGFVCCYGAVVDKCIAIGTTGSSGSGFMDNQTFDSHYSDCHAEGFDWCGFTTWESTGTLYSDCTSHPNAGYGFNCEDGRDVGYANCQAGIALPGWSTIPTPFGAATEQGNDIGFMNNVGSLRTRYAGCQANWNVLNGFHCGGVETVGRTVYTGCTAALNAASGWVVQDSNDTIFSGCAASENSQNGIYLTNCARVTISGGELFANLWNGLRVAEDATWAETDVSWETIITWNNAGDEILVNGVATTRALNVTGSRAGNAALASLLTKLAALGLITDSSS